MKLVKRIEIEKPGTTYNLHVENDHNYVAESAVVSNCHKSKADVLRKLLSGPFRNVPIRWGLTGTLPEEDHERTSVLSCIGPTHGVIKATHLQEKGVLADLHIHVQQLVDTRAFTDYQSELKWLTTDPTRISAIADMITSMATSENTLVLVDRISSGQLLHELIPNSVFISGTVKSDDRKKEYKSAQFENGKVIIATYGTCSTGISINRIFNLVLLEPGKSFVRVIQSIGRGLRVAEDKSFVNVYDITSTCKYAKRHLTKRKKHYKEAGYPFTINKIKY